MRKILAASLVTASIFGGVQSAHAASDKDMQLIGRALSFVENGQQGDVTVSIAYSDSVAGSKEEADAVAALLGGGLNAGKVTLKPSVTPVSALPSNGVVYVPEGMSAEYGAISSSPAITVSTDKACADAGACVVAVQSAPSVEIYVSKSAADTRSVSFSTAFRMMIKEL